MRRILLTALMTLTALVLLLSYRTSLSGTALGTTRTITQAAAPGVPSAASTTKDGSSSGSTASAGSTGSSGAGTASTSSKAYTGSSVDTRWGPVQVQIAVSNGKIISAQAVQYPNGNGRDYEINSRALPVLNQEVVTKQSAQIDTVSGASVTSDGYVQSLQSAIDAAHL